MYDLNYFEGLYGNFYPFIEKNGSRIIARPIGADLIDRLEREASNGQSHACLLQFGVSEDGVSLPHPEVGTQDEDGGVSVSMEIKPAGLPGYNVSFPTNLPIGRCYQIMSGVIPVRSLWVNLMFEIEGKGAHMQYFQDETEGSRTYFSFFPREGGVTIKAPREKERLDALVKGKSLGEILNEKAFAKILTGHSRTTFMIDGSESGEEDKLQFFWYETNSHYEDERPFDKIFVVNATRFDQALLDLVAKASSFQIGKEEFEWLKRLFDEQEEVFRAYLFGNR